MLTTSVASLFYRVDAGIRHGMDAGIKHSLDIELFKMEEMDAKIAQMDAEVAKDAQNLDLAPYLHPEMHQGAHGGAHHMSFDRNHKGTIFISQSIGWGRVYLSHLDSQDMVDVDFYFHSQDMVDAVDRWFGNIENQEMTARRDSEVMQAFKEAAAAKIRKQFCKPELLMRRPNALKTG